MTLWRTTLAVALLAPGLLAAQDPRVAGGRTFETYGSVEYLWPTKADRPINTLTADVGLSRIVSPSLGLSVGLGLTATVASGRIYQDSGTGGRDTLESSAVGLGPSVRIAFTPLRFGRLSLGAEASAGLILYSEPFPAGGRQYNGMLRVGPSLSVAISDADRLTVSGKWMHVSNGQGLGPHNPSYEAMGVAVGFTHRFSRAEPTPAVKRRQLIVGIAGGVLGAVGGALLSRHCSGDACRISPGITAAGALLGATSGIVIASF